MGGGNIVERSSDGWGQRRGRSSVGTDELSGLLETGKELDWYIICRYGEREVGRVRLLGLG